MLDKQFNGRKFGDGKSTATRFVGWFSYLPDNYFAQYLSKRVIYRRACQPREQMRTISYTNDCGRGNMWMCLAILVQREFIICLLGIANKFWLAYLSDLFSINYLIILTSFW